MGWEIKNSNDIQYGRRVYPRSLELIHERRYAYVAYDVHGFRAVWSLWLPTEVEVHVLVQDGLVMIRRTRVGEQLQAHLVGVR